MGSSGQMDVLGFTGICAICGLSMGFETDFPNTIFLRLRSTQPTC